MKKKFFLKFFLFTVIATLVTFTSCKDYDDDINDLQNQITNLSGVSSGLESAKTDIAAAQTAADAAATAAADALAKAEEALTAAENAGDADAIAAAQAAADNAQAAAEAAQTKAEEVEAEAERLLGLIEALEGRVNALETLDNASQEDVDALAIEVQAIKDQIAESMGGKAIAYLTVIPDYVSENGGALPILNFSPLVTEDCGEIVPATIARFQVSPDDATVDMIDVDGISFKYNNPTTRSAAIAPKATFKSLENGVLEVWVEINTEKIEAPTSNKIDQIMLMVPLKEGGQVNSDWMTVSSDPINGLTLVNVQEDIEEGEEANYAFPTTLQGAKDLEVEDLPVVELVYNETLDLLTVVDAWSADIAAMINLDTYNLEYTFDLKDEDGKTIVYKLGENDTDQQEFINLVGSEINTRVYDIDEANPASIDRTPIVHVSLMNDDCVVAEGFIKINIIRPEDVPTPPETVLFPVSGKVEADCEPFQLKVGTQEMNENFYAKAKLTKAEFHTRYTWAEVEGGVGTIEEIKDEADTESYNLVWTLTPTELADNIGKTVEKSGTYTYGGKVFEVTFSAEIIAPQADISSILLTNYWDDGLTYIQHNVRVPQSTTDDDPTNATFENNINNAFKTSGLILDLEAANEDYADYSYEYFFKSTQPIVQVDGITISVSADGKKLLATKDEVEETVATITNSDGTTGDILEYMDDSDLGKYLLNKGPEFMKATLYLAVTKCDGELDVTLTGDFNGEFDVHFLRPVNVESESADHFIDGVDVGAKGSVLDVRNVVRLSDWRNYAKDTEDYYFDPDHDNYYDFYGFTGISIDDTKIVPEGLVTSGGVELDELPSTIEVKFDPTVTTDHKNGKLTYKNNGAGLINQFTLKVPVTVNYKWGEVETVVRVLVKPTSANESIM